MPGFTSAGERIWPVPPDWTGGVQETLEWLSDVLIANATAVSQHRNLRIAPRRRLAFEVLAGTQDRRAADMLLAGYVGIWLLPIWPDVTWLNATLAAGANSVPCTPAGRDFVIGGKALLWDSLNSWEVVQVGSINSGNIGLSAPTAAQHGIGSRLYPLRRARVEDGAQERLYNEDVSRRTLTFAVDEPCDWPALAGPTTYLSHPVLDVRPNESEDPTADLSYPGEAVDYDVGPRLVHYLPGLALRTRQTHYKISGVAAHTWLRSLLYTLAGRWSPIWVPSWAADLTPAATIAGSSVSLSIDWAGYTLFGLGKPNRQDVRIELLAGTVYYRRITAAVEAGATETLTLSASLSASAITPAQIRQISFLTLSTLAGDEVEIDHATDIEGLAEVTLGWQAVVPDV